MRNPFSAPTVTKLFLSASPAEDTRFDEFFPYIRLANGTFKTTAAKRHEEVDHAICELLDATNHYRILDVAVSSGTGTVELSQRLSQAGIPHTMLGTDLTLWANYLRLPLVTILFDENHFLYQVDVASLAFPNTPPSKLSALVFFTGKYLLKLHRCFSHGAKRVQLLSRVARESDVLFETGDIFGLVVPKSLDPKFDVIRASNVLNRSYFSSDQITFALRNLCNYLKEGGLLVVNRTHESKNQFTVFQLRGAELSPVLDRNGGTDIRDIVINRSTRIAL